MSFNLSPISEHECPQRTPHRYDGPLFDQPADPARMQVALPSLSAAYDQRRDWSASEPGGGEAQSISIPLGHIGIVVTASTSPHPSSLGGPNMAIRVTTGERLGMHAVHLDREGRAARLDADAPHRQLPDLRDRLSERPSADPIIERLCRALEAAELDQDAFSDLYADAIRLAIFSRLTSLHSDTGTGEAEPAAPTPTALPKWRLKRVIEYIDLHLEETISLADMAAATGLSRMHFAAQFRAATGIRPHEFLLRRRIERAKQMLMHTGTSLVEVALSVGFQTQAHFTTVFKRFVGATPHRWRSANGTNGRDEGHDRHDDVRQHSTNAALAHHSI